MHYFLFIFIFLLSINFAKGSIIYTEPVRNAKFVSINNNIIVGLDEIIENNDLKMSVTVKGSVSGIHTGKIIFTKD